MAMNPICVLLQSLPRSTNLSRIAFTACSQASCGLAPCRISSTTLKEPTTRITSSPWPVAVTAPTSLSTYKPAPMMGESPMRPCILNAMPEVEHPPDKLPLPSIAIIPMVSWFSMLITGVYSAFLSHSFHSRSLSGTNKFTFSKPCSTANWVAPSPASITWGVFSITARATLMGLAMCSMQTTEPMLPFSSMMQASKVT